MKRKVNRRTFKMVRREEHVSLARYLNNHAEKLDATDQREAGSIVRAVAGNLIAGLAE